MMTTTAKCAASETVRFRKTNFDGTKLRLVVCLSLDHNHWYKLPPYRPIAHTESAQE